jgi:hypothetical protein
VEPVVASADKLHEATHVKLSCYLNSSCALLKAPSCRANASPGKAN